MPASYQGCKRLLLVGCGAVVLGTAGCGGNQGAGPAQNAVPTSPAESATKKPTRSHESVADIPNAAAKSPDRDRRAEEAAVAAIEKLDGRVHAEGVEKLITKVDLGRRAVTDVDLAHLKVFTQLQELDLHAPDVTDAGLQYLQDLTSLRVLDLNFTSITGPGLVHLRAMRRLEELDLGFSHIQDAGLEYLEGLLALQTLNLKLTSVTDAGLEHLKPLKNLRQLDVRLTKVTDEGVQRLKHVLPALQVEH
jgi:Leucine-rich repeat (LRR) protein